MNDKSQDIRYVVMHTPGPNWQTGVDFRQQQGVFEHVDYYARMLEEGMLAFGGPYLTPDRGGMMVPKAGMTLEEVEEYSAADPAVISGLLNFEVVPWLLAMRGE